VTEARTQLLTAMMLMELANAVSARSLRYPVFKVGVFKNKFLWYAIVSSFALQLVVLYTPSIQAIFDVSSPEPIHWAFAILFTAMIFGSLEMGKYIASKRRKRMRARPPRQSFRHPIFNFLDHFSRISLSSPILHALVASFKGSMASSLNNNLIRHEVAHEKVLDA